MIQFFWIIDFIGIFLSRLIISILFYIFFVNNFKKNKIKAFIYLSSALFIFLGFYTSFVALMWVIVLILKIIKNKKINFLILSLISYFLLLLSVGPGKLSIDRIFDIRYF